MQSDAPSVALLRELASQHGIDGLSDEDADAVVAFLRLLLPELRQVEALVPSEAEL